MATNIFFNNFFASQEQNLVQDLIDEAIKMYGLDCFYMPRRVINEDTIWREGETYDFDTAYELEMYVRDVNGFTGDGKFLSKFGLEIRDEVTFQISMRSFGAEIGLIEELERPREGDLVFFPLNRKCFQIKFVDQEDVFYQVGSLQMWSIVCEVFEYSNETFNTGLPDVDMRYAPLSGDTNDWQILTEDGYALAFPTGGNLLLAEFGEGIDDIDPGAMNEEIERAADEILDWSVRDPFSEGNY